MYLGSIKKTHGMACFVANTSRLSSFRSISRSGSRIWYLIRYIPGHVFNHNRVNRILNAIRKLSFRLFVNWDTIMDTPNKMKPLGSSRHTEFQPFDCRIPCLVPIIFSVRDPVRVVPIIYPIRESHASLGLNLFIKMLEFVHLL